jgi:hypothetical protein
MNEIILSTVDKKGNYVFPRDFNILSRKSITDTDTFDKRAAVADVIGGIRVGGKKGQIFDYDKLILRTTDPDLIDEPVGAIGNRMFTLSGEKLHRPDLHPSYPTILTGEDLGVQFKPAPREIVLNDFIKSFTEAKGRGPGTMDFTRGYAPSNLITEEMLTNLQKAGYAKGGMVKGYAKGGDEGTDMNAVAEYYGHRLDDRNSEMTQPVISDKGNVLHNMVAERNALADKYLGTAGRFASRGLEGLRTVLDEAPSFTGKTLSSMGIDPNYVPVVGGIVASARPARDTDVIDSQLKIGTDVLLGQLPETLYNYSTAGMPGPVLGGKWVPNSATDGMTYENVYGDINALDFLNLLGIKPSIKSGLTSVTKAMKSKVSKLPKK